MYENKMPRRIFGRKREEVTGEWRKLHNEELHNLYSFIVNRLHDSLFSLILSRYKGAQNIMSRTCK